MLNGNRMVTGSSNEGVTLNASNYWNKGLYQTPNPNPNPNPSAQ